MTLALYKLPNAGGRVSDDFTFSNPIVWEASPVGGILEARYYLRMENGTDEYLTQGRLYAVDTSETDESGWFSFAEDVGGEPGQYASEFLFEIPLGSEIPVWIRLAIPAGTEVKPKDDLRIAATYMEHLEEDDD